MDTTLAPTDAAVPVGAPRLPRWLPMTGALFGILSLAADLVIGDFPDGSTSPAALARYYAVHHSNVGTGGLIAGIATVFLGIFAAVLAARCRAIPVAAAVIAVGGAASLAHEEWSAGTYYLMGHLSTEPGVTPAALQAWHIAGAEFGIGSAMTVLLIGIALAGLLGRAVPRWLAASGLVLGLAHFLPNPWGFFAAMLTLLWFVVAGIALSVRQAR